MANEKSRSTESKLQIRYCDFGLSPKAPPQAAPTTAPAVMGSFGQAVSSLLDTYSKCLALLKGSRLGSQGLSSEPPVRLASSLRSDQASIRRTYSSRLSQNGARFNKGDAAARSSLRRVIKRLTAALADAVRTLSRRQRHSVDYDSLMSLSRVSSVDAIRTINDLASRVGSEAGSRRSAVSSRDRPRSRPHHRHSQRDDGMKSNKSGSASRSDPRRQRQQPQPQHRRQRSTPKSLKSSKSSKSCHSSQRLQHQEETHGNRVSMLTMSSDSTKLGEIRRRQSRLVMDPASRVTYPLYAYRPEAKEKKKWWGLLGGR